MDHQRKEGHDEEEQEFLSSAPSRRDDDHVCPPPRRQYWRLVLEGIMAVIIVALLVRPPSFSCKISDERASRTPVPEFPKKMVTFVPQPRYVNEDMFTTDNRTMLAHLHNWIELSAAARGYVQVPDREKYSDLGDPYTVAIDRHTDGPGYMMSVFHQLHCLSYLVEHLQAGYTGVELTKKVAHHTAHCFDYIRQGIICAADTTLEGSTEAGPGFGNPHECKDYDAVLEWANKHGAMAWRNELLPSEATLSS
ncbi:protein of unknown function (DUF3328) domain containing protein [Naviculisporaceae sp. PSN 640]